MRTVYLCCGASVAEDAPPVCPSCDTELPAGSRFCNKCGNAIVEPTPVLTPLSLPSATEGWGVRLGSCRNADGSWGRGFYQPKWTSHHNTERPHQALGHLTPADVFCAMPVEFASVDVLQSQHPTL